MKKVLALALALVLVLSLAACGSDKSETSNTESSKPETSAQEETKKDDGYLTDAEIRSLVSEAIMEKVKEFNDKYDASLDVYQTRYTIDNIKTGQNLKYFYDVTGTYTTYKMYSGDIYSTNWFAVEIRDKTVKNFMSHSSD